MGSIFDPALEAAVRSRVACLTVATPAKWGRMTSSQMLCHLVDSFRVPLGETSARPRSTPLRFAPLRWLLVFVLPWPKGRLPTMPEFQQTKPETWERDRAAWEAALTRFVARGRQAQPTWSPHPAFGTLPNWEWGRMVYLHIDHHLRQFGA
jgi:hypothetical protein